MKRSSLVSTEAVSPRFRELELWPTRDAVAAMLEAQLAAAAAVAGQADAIAAAADAAAARLRDPAGRLIYVGAGTSGRLAVLDGVELGPTFGWEEHRTRYLLAGGPEAMMRGVEGAEDDADAAERAVAEAEVGLADVVIGVAASGRTPFTLAAVRAAAGSGALTVALAGSSGSPLLEAAAHPLLVETGAEVLAGSTRMKAGTAQKIALNTLSTAIMMRLGYVHDGLMVGMRPTNGKLRRRAAEMVARIADVEPGAAAAALERAGGRIKLAVLVARGLPPGEGAVLLAETGDDLRAALARIGPGA